MENDRGRANSKTSKAETSNFEAQKRGSRGIPGPMGGSQGLGFRV